MLIKQQIEIVSQKYAVKPALIFKDAQVPFVRLRQEVFKLANVLKNQGIAKGDKVGLYLPNSPEYVYGYLACFCLGAVAVPLDYMLKNEELISCLDHSEAKLLVAKPRPDIDLHQIQSQVKSLKKIIVTEGEVADTLSLSQLMVQATAKVPDIEIRDDDPALIMYTSGTTGKPKGILLNYKHLEGSPKAMEHFVDLSDQDTKLCAIPLSHIGGFIYIQNCIKFGITLVLMERFSPFEFLEDISKYKVTCFHIVPPMYTAMLTVKDIAKYDLSTLRWVVVFGAPSSPEILERFHKYCQNAKLLNGWGMTETSPPNTVTPLDSKNIASVGKPSPVCEIKIFDEDQKEVAVGEIGEIVIRGQYIMAGYYKDPQGTQDILKKGWLYTGDLGRFDKDGFLYIVGRKKEMIKVAGQIVYAPEVEAVLYKHQEIAEAAVIGVPDKMKGEAVLAVVVLKEGSKLTPEDIRYFTREQLANFKVPATVEIRKELPKNRTGKIDKELLKQELVAQS
jgi:long-chain acyl-CoA synthetase